MIVLLMFGLLEIGRVMLTQGVLMYAAEEATRFAIVNFSATEQEIRDHAESKFLLVNAERIDAVVVDAPIDPSDNTRRISVRIDYNYVPLLPLPGIQSFPLHGQSRGFLAEG